MSEKRARDDEEEGSEPSKRPSHEPVTSTAMIPTPLTAEEQRLINIIRAPKNSRLLAQLLQQQPQQNISDQPLVSVQSINQTSADFRKFKERLPWISSSSNFSKLRKAQRQFMKHMMDGSAFNEDGTAFALVFCGGGKTLMEAASALLPISMLRVLRDKLPASTTSERCLIVLPTRAALDNMVEYFKPSSTKAKNLWCKWLPLAADATQRDARLNELCEHTRLLDSRISISDRDKAWVVVASTQVVSRQVEDGTLNLQDFGLVVFDEGDYGTVSKDEEGCWKKILEKAKEVKILSIMFSGTYKRADGMQDILPEPFMRFGYPQCLEEGVVKKLIVKILHPTTDGKSLYEHMKEGSKFEFNMMRHLIMKQHDHLCIILKAMMDCYIEHVKETEVPWQIIVVSPDQDHLNDITFELNNLKYECPITHEFIEFESVTSEDSVKAKRVLEEFKNQRKYRGIVNIQMLGRAFDAPLVGVTMVLRPFNTLAFFTQTISRPLRVLDMTAGILNTIQDVDVRKDVKQKIKVLADNKAQKALIIEVDIMENFERYKEFAEEQDFKLDDDEKIEVDYKQQEMSLTFPPWPVDAETYTEPDDDSMRPSQVFDVDDHDDTDTQSLSDSSDEDMAEPGKAEESDSDTESDSDDDPDTDPDTDHPVNPAVLEQRRLARLKRRESLAKELLGAVFHVSPDDATTLVVENQLLVSMASGTDRCDKCGKCFRHLSLHKFMEYGRGFNWKPPIKLIYDTLVAALKCLGAGKFHSKQDVAKKIFELSPPVYDYYVKQAKATVTDATDAASVLKKARNKLSGRISKLHSSQLHPSRLVQYFVPKDKSNEAVANAKKVASDAIRRFSDTNTEMVVACKLQVHRGAVLKYCITPLKS